MVRIVFILFALAIIFPVSAQRYERAEKLANDAYANGDYQKATLLYKQAVIIAGKEFGTKHATYSVALSSYAYMFAYHEINFDRADSLYDLALSVNKHLYTENSPEYVNMLESKVVAHFGKGELVQLVKEYNEVLKKQSAIGDTKFDKGTTLNNYGLILHEVGIYDSAEKVYKNAIEYRRKDLGEQDPYYAQTLSNLGLTYLITGSYEKAEQLYVQVKSIYEKNPGKETEDYAQCINNLGGIYDSQGLTRKALDLYEEALTIREEIFGREHPAFLESFNNAAVAYSTLKMNDLADSLYEESIRLRKIVYGETHPKYATALNNLAVRYNDLGKFAQAFTLYEQVLDIFKRTLGEGHLNCAVALNGMSTSAYGMKDFAKAFALNDQALTIAHNAVGPEHYSPMTMLELRGRLNRDTKNYQEARKCFLEIFQRHQHMIRVSFSSFSESEKLTYIKAVNTSLQNLHDLAFLSVHEQPYITGDQFNALLFQKGLIFYSSQKLKKAIQQSTDSNLKNILKALSEVSDSLAQTWNMTLAETKQKGIDVKNLENRRNELQREISRKASLLPGYQASAEVNQNFTWQMVREKLKEKEAVVEIVRYYQHQDINNSVYAYAALVLLPDKNTFPMLIPLGQASDFEKDYIAYYTNTIKFKVPDTTSYRHFWMPVAKFLKQHKIKKAFVCPDGIYYSINLATLKNPQSNRYACDELDIQLIGNSKDLIVMDRKSLRSDKSWKSNLELFGFPEYGASEKNNPLTERSVQTSGFDSTSRFFDVKGKIIELPGTRKEVENIESIARKNAVKTVSRLQKEASEKEVKAVHNPAVLHIATHGFFMRTADDNRNNPLLRSGLLLAGVENGLKGITTDGEDGVLVAEEALNLQLDSTELVVLSACETGLGEINGSEGVYGLQRSFQQAGAKSVIMSLWNVSDEATQEMMTYFYSDYLSGKDKWTSFSNARKKLRKKYDHPYYWGAFVLIGN